MTIESFFASCPRGLEAVLGEELAALGALDIAPTDGGVAFRGPFDLCYAVNLESRVASRVLWQVAYGTLTSEEDLYAAIEALPWSGWFPVSHSIRVDVSAIRATVRSLDFVTLRIKDAVCDAFRKSGGARPDVDTRAPDVRIQGFLTDREYRVYLDTSGDPLFKRGYRGAAGDAPLKENLAAGVLKLIGYDGRSPLLDPMCGSGTFLCEAALIALNRAPGLERQFGFEKLSVHDETRWKDLQKAARARVREADRLPIWGSDRYGEALKLARANLAALGLEGAVELKQADVLEMPPPAESGLIVTNPPYGVRQQDLESLAALYPKLGDTLKKKYAGWTAYFLTADLRLAKLLGLSPSRRTPLFNGALECRLFEVKVFAGSGRKNA